MKFWDTSAIIPIIIEQSYSAEIKQILKTDPHMIVFWGTIVESLSALSRLQREHFLDDTSFKHASGLLETLIRNWTEILPGNDLREQAIRIVSVHGLKTLDSLQLSAALIWTNKRPVNNSIVSLDKQLRTAAGKEGFIVLPEIADIA